MDIIGFFLVWVPLSGWTLIDIVRSGEAPFLFSIKVSKSEDIGYYWGCVLFWLLLFGASIYKFVSLSIRAFFGEPPFRTEGFWPTTIEQWALLAVDFFVMLLFAYIVWSRVRLNRFLREIESEERA
jgi:hypothetical protein